MKAIKGKFFSRGVHPSDMKDIAKDFPIEEMKPSDVIGISICQHIGKPAEPVVQKDDYVKRGQLIAKASGFVSANIYSSVSGTVIGIEKHHTQNGQVHDFIMIKNDGLDETVSLEPLKEINSQTIKDRIAEAGLVGMGGAGFPTVVKLSPKTPVDTLVINGAECEPYLTCDYRLMIEKTNEVAEGIRLLAKSIGVSKIMLGIEANKPDAIAAFEQFDDIQVVILKKRYPMGSEKHLIYCTTGRKVPTGKLPSDAGCVVQNIATAFATYEAVCLNKPLYERVLTVSGKAITSPKNLLVRFGTSTDEIFAYCGGIKDDALMLVSGGPMMGAAMISDKYYTKKADSGLLALTKEEVCLAEPTPCLHCGKCADVCPMHLLPMEITFYTLAGDYDMANKIGGVMNCISCGCCSYVCPAKRPLVQNIALCKSKLAQKAKGGK